jgi:hypothetical protein
MTDAPKTNLIDEILELELAMFLSVPSRGPAPCREHPDSFRLMRRAQFESWSHTTLQHYLNDLKAARQRNDNLMTLKYARMENLVPLLNDSPLINRMVEIQAEWHRDVSNKYPYFSRTSRPVDDLSDQPGAVSFSTYLRGELETYSNRTLASLYDDMQKVKDRGGNMAEDIFDRIVRTMGFDSLDEAEQILRAKHDG